MVKAKETKVDLRLPPAVHALVEGYLVLLLPLEYSLEVGCDPVPAVDPSARGHRADHLVTALKAALGSMSAGKRLTLTWDQGSEMAHHDQVARLFSQGVFFANPGSPWMRGTNENTNGLLRQYLPKAPT